MGNNGERTPHVGQESGVEPGSSTSGWVRVLSVLLISLVIFSILFMSGQLALLLPLSIAKADTSSHLNADYGYWVPVSLQPINPGIIEELRRDDQTFPGSILVAGDYWLSPTGDITPVSTVVPTNSDINPATETPGAYLISLVPTAIPTQLPYQPPLILVSTSTATQLPGPALATHTPAPTSTRQPAVPPTSTSTRTPTLSWTASRTPTVTPSRTPTPTHTSTNTTEPSHTATATSTSVIPSNTATNTLTPTHTATSTSTATHTATSTPTLEYTVTDEPTPVNTVENTRPATNTPTVVPPPPEVEIGPPDGVQLDLNCGSSLILDLGTLNQIDALIYYEFYNPSGCGGGICLDWVIIELSETYEGPWTEIFNWGDNIGSNNGSVMAYHYATQEEDNEAVPLAELFYGYGIVIPVNDTYRYVQIHAPDACGDAAQVDAIDTLP